MFIATAPLIKTRKRSDLYNRAKIINSSQADLYLSIHLNADANPTWHGAQIFYSNKNHENKKIADALKDSLNLNRENKMTNDLYMYRLITKPGCLIELGFLSNLSDKNKLSSSKYQEEIAKKITHALVKYYKLWLLYKIKYYVIIQ